jgi:hypothetical protein
MVRRLRVAQVDDGEALRWATAVIEGVLQHTVNVGKVRCRPKWVESGGGDTHRGRVDGGAAAPNPTCPVVDGGAAAPNPTCPVVDSGGGAVKWNRGVTKCDIPPLSRDGQS